MKKCGGCEVEKLLSEFNKNKRRKDGLQPWCKDCNKRKSKQYYSENKENHKKTILLRKKENYKKIRDKIDEVKANCQCLFCEETEPICLDFHHIDKSTKKIRIAAIASSNCSMDKLQEELRKCILVCANCHRKLHSGKISPLDARLAEYPPFKR